MEQRVELLETVDVEARLELVLGWMREMLADLELKDKIRTERHRRSRQAAARDVVAPPDGRRSARSSATATTTSSRSTAPSSRRRNCPTRCALAVDKELDRLERMGAAEPRTGVGAQLARRGRRTCRGASSPTSSNDISRRARRAGRRSRRPGRREGPHPRVPGRARAAPRARLGQPRAVAVRVRSSRWSVRPASARRRWVSRLRVRWVVRSCVSPSAVCATRPRSAVTGVPTSVRGPVASCVR